MLSSPTLPGRALEQAAVPIAGLRADKGVAQAVDKGVGREADRAAGRVASKEVGAEARGGVNRR